MAKDMKEQDSEGCFQMIALALLHCSMRSCVQTQTSSMAEVKSDGNATLTVQIPLCAVRVHAVRRTAQSSISINALISFDAQPGLTI